jgi:peptidoglycan/LPS O-acetylase OafA/YrhL
MQVPAGGTEMKQRFEVLDSWRGIAALMVALYHLLIPSHFQQVGLITNGGLFVDFFFVLSGFVITHAYLDPLQSGLPFGTFIIRRIGRLWPLHIAILAILVMREFAVYGASSAGLIPLQPVFEGGTGLLQLAESVFFVQAVGIDRTHSWNGPAWSIATEFWAYVVFAVLALVARKKNAFTAAAIVIAAIGAAVVALYSPTYMTTHFDHGIFRCLYGFFVGHLTYRAFASTQGMRSSTLLELVVLLVAGAYITNTNILPANPWTMIAPLVFAVVVWVFAFEAGRVSSLLRRPLFLALGLWSYSIYMVHDFIAFAVIKFVNGCASTVEAEVSALYRLTCRAVVPPEVFSNPWTLDAVSIVFLAIVIALSALTYRLIEVPGRTFFNELAKRWSVRTRQRVSPTSP